MFATKREGVLVAGVAEAIGISVREVEFRQDL